MKFRKISFHLFSSLVCFLISPVCQGLEIRVYNPDDHDRFDNISTAPVKNSTFLYASTNLTGVGWYIAPNSDNNSTSRRRQYTLVSPKHFLGANHFRPSTNGSIRFVATDGTVRDYAIGSTQAILNDEGEATDLFIGTLENSIPDSHLVDFQPYLSLPASVDPAGTEFIFLGHQPGNPPNLRAGRGVMGAFSDFGNDPITGGGPINKTRVFVSAYASLGGNVNDAHAQVGDSGSPCIVPVGSQGAIVGTHTAVANVLGTVETFHTYVPFYINELNAIMDDDGYHMRRAVPAIHPQPTTTLAVTPSVPATIRAGYPFTVSLVIQNTGLTDAANNIKLSQNLPSGSLNGANGTLWVTSGELEARKGGLSVGETTQLNVNLTIEQPTSLDASISLSADEFSEITQPLTLTVIESFRSFTSNLTLKETTDDPDGDGIINIFEYAFGGDPATASHLLANSSERLLPAIDQDESQTTFSFIRRTDAAARALTYKVQRSADLTQNSWEDFSFSDPTVSPLGNGLERVTFGIPTSASKDFFRIEVQLSE